MARDLEPLEAFAEETKTFVRSRWRRLLDRGRVYLTEHLLLLSVGAIAGGGAAIALLPIFAGVVCAVVAITAVIYAIYSRRLMADERAKRRWAHVQGKRIQQRELRAQAAIDNAILAISGDRSAVRGRNAELTQALAHFRAQSAQAHTSGRPQPPGAVQHAPVAPAAPDLEPVRRRLKQRQADIDVLEAEIQSLSVPDDTELQKNAETLRKAETELTAATRQADRLARDRRRLGQTPTTPQGSNLNMRVTLAPEGVRDVRRTEPPRTPEQLTVRALEQRPPSR